MSDNLDCLVCLDNKPQDAFVFYKNCSHFSCKDCLSHWEKQSNKCPVCRANIENEDVILTTNLTRLSVALEKILLILQQINTVSNDTITTTSNSDETISRILKKVKQDFEIATTLMMKSNIISSRRTRREPEISDVFILPDVTYTAPAPESLNVNVNSVSTASPENTSTIPAFLQTTLRNMITPHQNNTLDNRSNATIFFDTFFGNSLNQVYGQSNQNQLNRNNQQSRQSQPTTLQQTNSETQPPQTNSQPQQQLSAVEEALALLYATAGESDFLENPQNAIFTRLLATMQSQLQNPNRENTQE